MYFGKSVKQHKHSYIYIANIGIMPQLLKSTRFGKRVGIWVRPSVSLDNPASVCVQFLEMKSSQLCFEICESQQH